MRPFEQLIGVMYLMFELSTPFLHGRRVSRPRFRRSSSRFAEHGNTVAQPLHAVRIKRQCTWLCMWTVLHRSAWQHRFFHVQFLQCHVHRSVFRRANMCGVDVLYSLGSRTVAVFEH